MTEQTEQRARAECELRYLLWEMSVHLEQNRCDKALESLKNANIVANRIFGKGNDRGTGVWNDDKEWILRGKGLK